MDLRAIARAQAEGKYASIGPNPRLEAFLNSDDPISVYQPGAPRQGARLQDRRAPTYMRVAGRELTIDHAINCLRLYGDTVSTANWHLESEDGTRLVETKTKFTAKDSKVGPKDLYTLLKQPNPYMDYAEMMDLMIWDLLLSGNAYWYKWRMSDSGKPMGIFRLAPQHVEIVPGPYGPSAYEYQIEGMQEPMRIQPQQMMHFRLPNPHSAYYGMGVIQTGGRALDLELSLTDTQASFFENKADPSLIIQSERRVPRDVFNKLLMQLRRRASGSSNAGEMLLLEAGLTAQTLSRTASEALFDVLSRMSRDRVYAMFRAAPVLFGIMDETTGSNKVSDFRREFDTKTMRPFMDKLQRRMTSKLTAAWGIEFKIDYNYVMPQEELIEQVSKLAAIPGIKVREIRRQLRPLDIEESTGDSEIDEEVLNMPMENMDATGQGGAPDRPLAGEPGRPPRGENTTNFQRTRSPRVEGKSLDAVMADLDRRIEEAKATPQIPRHAGEPRDQHAKARSAALDDAAALIERELKEAARVLERGLLDHSEGKAFKEGDDLVKRIRESEAWKTFREQLESTLTKGLKRVISASSMHTPGADDLDYDAIAKKVMHRSDGITGIIRTLKNSVAKRVREVRNTAGDKADTDAAIREAIQVWRGDNAATIALTEAVHAYNEATIDIAEELGHEYVFVTDGEDHDPPCQNAHGSVWTLDYARDHRLEHPNCRRAFLLLD